MRSIRKPALAAFAASIAVVSLAGCSGGGGEESSAAEGEEFVLSLVADPGALDPQMSAGGSLFALSRFAYDSLVSVDETGEIGSQLAKDWTVDGTTVTLTLNEGITCSDDSEFTAQTAADNIAWVGRPREQEPVPRRRSSRRGITAEADGSTLTLTLAAPAPFVLQGLANLPMVCDAGLEDRSAARRRDARHRPVRARRGRGERPLHLLRSTRTTPGVPAARPPTRRACPRPSPRASSRTRRRRRTCCSRATSTPRTIVGPDRDRLAAAGLFQTDDPGRHRRAVVQPRRGPADVRPGGARRAHAGSRPRRAAEGAHQQPG